MPEYLKPEEGNLIHLNGPSLIPNGLVEDFRGIIEKSPVLEETRNRCLVRFEEALEQNPAYVWENAGQPLSFYIYKECDHRVEILWCHQLSELFPAEIYFRPAAHALFMALIEDLHARRIVSQFSSWSSVIGIDLPSTAFPGLGFQRFDVEIMTANSQNIPKINMSDLDGDRQSRLWESDRIGEAAELMASVGDAFMKYVGFTPKECQEAISKVCDPELSWMIMDENGRLLSFITLNRKGWIGQLFTLENYQGQGLGKYLLSSAIQVLMQQEVHHYSLAVFSGNQRAKKLYRGLGFTTKASNPIWAWLADSSGQAFDASGEVTVTEKLV